MTTNLATCYILLCFLGFIFGGTMATTFGDDFWCGAWFGCFASFGVVSFVAYQIDAFKGKI